MSNSQSRQLVVLAVLALTATLSPVSMDILTPSLPGLSTGLAASPQIIELNLYSFLIGYGIAPSLWGPLSDRMGRRPIMFAGMVVYCVSSFAGALADDAQTLILIRFVQGMGGGAGATVARAVVRDIHGEAGTTRSMAHMISLMSVVPFFMPMAGGFLASAFSWKACFIVMGLIGGISLAAFMILVPETRPRGSEVTGEHIPFMRILTHRTFAGHAVSNMFCISTLVIFGANFSFILEQEFGFSSGENGLVLSMFNGSIALGTYVVWWLMKRMGAHQAILTGGLASSLGWLGIGLLTALGYAQASLLMPMLVIAAGGCGVIMSLCSGGALTPFSRNSGTASSLYLLLQSAGACLVSFSVGLLLPKELLAISLATSACAAMAVVSKIALSERNDSKSTKRT